MHKNENDPLNTSQSIPKPVFIRLLMLFGGGIGCLVVGIIVSLVTGDFVLLAMSAILCISFTVKGFLLKRKINLGQIYSVSGVCVGIVPKILGRYRRIELVDTITGGDTHFILPKKVLFKIGHVYTCYFDNQISNRLGRMVEQYPKGTVDPVNINNNQGGCFNADIDLPTNGFLGFEDFGIYQEKQVIATASTEAAEIETPPVFADTVK